MIFRLRNALDPERIDVVELREGALLADTQATGKYTPLINVSQFVKVELDDDAVEQAVDHEAGAMVTPSPTRREELGVPSSVHLESRNHARWGLLPADEERPS